jgi:alpha-1,6-mannosyltransferase
MAVSIQLDAPAVRPGLLKLAPGWVGLGAAGSLLLTISGARLGGGTVNWWFHPHVLSGAATKVLFYAGMAALALAWLGVGGVLRNHRATTRDLWSVALLWGLPLAIGAPLFSRDAYSYLAQGTIAHLGLNPYHEAPVILGRLGQAHVLHAVDPFWRSATAPYGPLFLGAVSVIVAVTGAHLVAGVLLIRALELVGLVLVAVFIPRLARATGADPARALWLTILSPIVLLQLVAPAHNDLLMIGVMLAGVTLALEGRALWGVALCAVAATIKVPAIAAAIFVAFAWARAVPDWRARIARSAQAAAIAVAVAAAVTIITGFGLGWISSALFSTPARVRLAITPATDLSWTLASLLRDVGASVTFRGLESVLRAVAFAATALVALALLRKTATQTIPRYLGLALMAFALGGPAVWPWYLCWGLVLLAVWAPAQRSRALVLTVLLGSFLVKPNGILALPLGSSPVVAALWIAAAALACYAWIRGDAHLRSPEFNDRVTRSALVEP